MKIITSRNEPMELPSVIFFLLYEYVMRKYM